MGGWGNNDPKIPKPLCQHHMTFRYLTIASARIGIWMKMAMSKFASASSMEMHNICFNDVQYPWSITTVSQSDSKNRGSPKTLNVITGQFHGSIRDMSISPALTGSTTCPNWLQNNQCFNWPNSYKPLWVKMAIHQRPPILECPNDVREGCFGQTQNKNIDPKDALKNHPPIKSVCNLQLSGKFNGFTQGMDCAGSGTTICGANLLKVNACDKVDGSKRQSATACKTSGSCTMKGPEAANTCVYG